MAKMALYNDLRRPIAEEEEYNKHYSLTSRLGRLKNILAPQVRLELTTLRLTAACSTD